GTLNCGTCSSGYVCNSTGQCVSGTCSPTEVCTDGLDNDCDGLIDCKDSDCSGLNACICTSPVAEVCNNGKDDDCDGLIDCVDSDCSSNNACQSCNPQCSKVICKPRTEICNNGLDDDCDNTIDCVDSDCSTNLFCCVGDQCGCPNGMTLCSDGVCRASCSVDPPCNNNGVCDSGESCTCADCFSKQDSCKPGNICDANTKHCECQIGLLPCSDGSCKDHCGACGDNVIDPGESCDGSQWGSIENCKDLGFSGGTLSCTLNCNFNTSNCIDSVGFCGDGVRNVGEECDGFDWGPIDSCSDLGFSGGVLDCSSNCKFDTSGCYDVPGCDSDDDCPSGAVCGGDGKCGCPDGTDLCADGSCSSSCSFKGCVGSPDNICSSGESCHCADCEGFRNSCEITSSCVSGFCKECKLTSALWDVDNCDGNTCVVANDSSVDLFVVGSDGCSGKSFKFRVYLDGKPNNIVGYPPSAVFSNAKASSSWNVFWKDVSGFLGLGDDDPVYSFYARTASGVSRNSDNKIKVCDNDDDCDGVPNSRDLCSHTPYGSTVDKDTGCDPEQAECISFIDCTNVPWGECDETNIKKRNICRITNTSQPDPLGDQHHNFCCNNPDTCFCSFKDGITENCRNNPYLSSWIPVAAGCLVEEEFPFFSSFSILIVLSILLCYYILFRGDEK
ncbi:MAG: hypothetical protein QXR60_04490, partial [Candidatus Nanoarchaeia archaeon]